MAVIEYDEYKQKLQALEPTLGELEKALGIPKDRQELKDLQAETEQDGFWNNIEHSQKVSQQIKRLEHRIKKYDRLVSEWEDTVTLCDIAQAVGAAFVSASWRSGDVDKPCLVASGMGALMDEVYTGLDALCKERLQSVTVAALEARLFDGKPLAGPCGRAKKEKAAAAHGGAK